MKIEITEEHELIRETTRRWVEKEVLPHVDRWEEDGDIPRDMVTKMAAQGIIGAPFPPEYGGAGLDYLGYIIATEEVARGCSSLRTTLSVQTSLCGMTLFQYGSEAQRKNWVVPLAKGEKMGAWALTEPSSGSDAAALRTTARKQEGKWILNGRKLWISNGDKADYVVVFARTNEWDPKRKHEGICAFLVEKGSPGFSAGSVYTTNKLGLRASHTAELVMENCEIPADHLIGKEGQGWEIALGILNYGRLSVAAGAVGIAAAALDAAVAYAKQRQAFGRPIGDFQLVQAMLAEMSTDLEAARWLVYRAAALKVAGHDNRLAVSQAKLLAAEASMRITEKAVQVHGGAGYSMDYPVERYFRDAKICGIYEGTNEIHKLLIAGYLLGKQ